MMRAVASAGSMKPPPPPMPRVNARGESAGRAASGTGVLSVCRAANEKARGVVAVLPRTRIEGIAARQRLAAIIDEAILLYKEQL